MSKGCGEEFWCRRTGDHEICGEVWKCDDCRDKERKHHKEFIEDVKHASALPAQTCRALGPESEEDISMYAEDKN